MGEILHKLDPPLGMCCNCLYEGSYVIHLRRLLAAGIPRSSLRIYISEHFFTNPSQVVKDALAFIGLDPAMWDTNISKDIYNGRGKRPLTPTTRLEASVERLMREIMRPFNVELFHFLTGRNSSWWE